MKRILSGLFFLLVITCSSQNWQWATRAGGDKSDKATDISIDEYGNAYVVGYYNTPNAGNVNFGSIMPVANFGKEGFLAKINKNGTWQWVRSAIGGWDERVLGVHVDTVNNFIYATGTAWEYTNFGSCPAVIPQTWMSDQIFVSKFDYYGNCLWHVEAGGEADDQGYDLVTSQSGNIYLTGFISDKYVQGNVNAIFGSYTVPIPTGDSLAFVAKMSTAGVWQWVRTFGGCDGERDNRIAIDEQENIYVTGGFYGTKVFGTSTLTSSGGVDIFVVKFNSAGVQQWVRKTGSAYNDRGNSVTVDKYGKVYVTGEFRDKVNFDLDTINNFGGPGGRDIFVAKMTSAGSWIWADKAGGTSGSDRGNMIIPNKNGNLYVTGQFKNNCKFSPTLSLTNTFDSVQVFVAGIDTGGVWRWALQGGSLNEDRGNSICVDDSCHIFATGYFDLTAGFGAYSVTTAGGKDIFVSRITDVCFEDIIIIDGNKDLASWQNAVGLAPNPGHHEIFIRGKGGVNFTEIDITDLNGRRIIHKDIDHLESVRIDIEELPPGLYIVGIKTNGEVIYKKLVKE